MKTKHAPGPWLVEKPVYKQNNVAYVILPANNSEQSTQGQAVARINASIDSESETHLANAQLIAAAPEMLEALEEIMQQSYNGMLPEVFNDAAKLKKLLNFCGNIASRAIAKAKGDL